MKKVLIALNLKEDATEAAAEKVVKKLQSDLEAQVKVGEEYSTYKPKAEKRIKELEGFNAGFQNQIDALKAEKSTLVKGAVADAEKIKELEEKDTGDSNTIKKLEEDVKVFEETVETLDKMVAKLEKDVALGQIPAKEITKLVESAFKNDKDLKELWGTGDGHLFKLEGQAKDHRLVIGGPVKHYTRD